MDKEKIDEELFAIIIQVIKLLTINDIRPFAFRLLYSTPISRFENKRKYYKLFLKTLKEKVESNSTKIDRADLIIDLLEMLIK